MTPDPTLTAFDLAPPAQGGVEWEGDAGGGEVIAVEALDTATGAPANVAVPPGAGFAIACDAAPLEGGDDPAFGTVRWRTLICADRTPSSGVVLGVAEFGPGDTLLPHRHGPAEVYYGLSGSGTVTIEGVAHEIRAGIAVYIPAEAEHAVVAGRQGLRFAYTFPTGRFAEVDYRFTRR
jgi:quercetin dioxygenase-like cupin family protein